MSGVAVLPRLAHPRRLTACRHPHRHRHGASSNFRGSRPACLTNFSECFKTCLGPKFRSRYRLCIFCLVLKGLFSCIGLAATTYCDRPALTGQLSFVIRLFLISQAAVLLKISTQDAISAVDPSGNFILVGWEPPTAYTTFVMDFHEGSGPGGGGLSGGTGATMPDAPIRRRHSISILTHTSADSISPTSNDRISLSGIGTGLCVSYTRHLLPSVTAKHSMPSCTQYLIP